MQQYKKRYLSGSCFAALCLLGTQSQAQPTTSELAISLTVLSECEIGTVNDLSFGSTAGTGTYVDQQASSTGTTRFLTGVTTSQQIPYQLFRDAARTQLWGNDTETSLSSTGNGTNQAIMVYGRVPDLTSAMPDTYIDNVTLSVAY